jgi:hypothetical protein
LGLNLVAAVVSLHGFALTLKDNAPGCVVEIGCWPEHPSGYQWYRSETATVDGHVMQNAV